MQTKLTTETIKPNENISFPIGTILTVQKIYSNLNFNEVFSKYKKKGRDINSLIQSLTSYKLTDNFSISRGSDWINKKEILNMFQLKEFEERTLFRVLEIIGKNREEIIADMQDKIFERYDFPHTDANLDWTSLVLYGEKSSLGKYGYSRDHRPDKKQITLGLAELASPINVPIGITINAGNKSDDKRIKEFDKTTASLIEKERRIYGVKFVKPSKFEYFYFSESLKENQIAFRIRKAKQKFEEAKELQRSLK